MDRFVKDFNIVENALDMRNLMRWNGRDLRDRENLAEHTHLVVACVIELYDELFVGTSKSFFINNDRVSFERLIRRCMLHDSLELLRGDILSVTKDAIPGLREFTNDEENRFISEVGVECSKLEEELVELADLKACYKFVEKELRYPSNNFALEVYKSTKVKFDNKYEAFCKKHNLRKPEPIVEVCDRFRKGYLADAGTDVALIEDVTILPMSTMSINLQVTVTPKEGEMAVLCARTSAAAKGLCVAMCPIDANYSGEVTAIVHNVSNEIITYKKGEAFCQVVGLPITQPIKDVVVKKEGKRSDGKLGSTGI